MASRIRSCREWTTGQIKCPSRPQVENYLYREMTAYPQRFFPLERFPCASNFSYLFLYWFACWGCVELKFLVGGVVFIPSVSTQRSSSSISSGVSAQYSFEELWYLFWLLTVKLLSHTVFKTWGLVFLEMRVRKVWFHGNMWNGCVFFCCCVLC